MFNRIAFYTIIFCLTLISASVAKGMDVPNRDIDKLRLIVQTGHTARVASVAFSPDGRLALSGSWDKTLRLWDVATGLELRCFNGHTGSVYSVAFSSDGLTAISGSEDSTLKLWDITTGRELHSFRGHDKPVYSVAFSPDGKSILSGSGDLTIKIWDLVSGQILRTLSGHTKPVTAVAISPDGRTILSGAVDNILKSWDVATGKELHTFYGHTSSVEFVTFSPDSKTALSGGDDDVMKLWNLSTGQEQLTFHGHKQWVASGKFSPDGLYVISGSGDKALKLWSVKTGQLVRTFLGHTKSISSVVFSQDGRTILSGSRDKTLRLWDAETGKELNILRGHTNKTYSITFIPENNTFVSGSWNNSQQVWDMASGQIVHTYNAKTSVVSSSTISVDNRYRLAGDDKNNLNLWDVISGTRLRTFTGHKGVIQCVAFSADGRTAVSGSDDKTLKLWEIETGRELHTFDGHTDLVSSAAFTSDGKLILSASGDNSIIIWSVATGKWIAKLYSFNDGTWAIIDSDGRFDSSNGGDVKGLHWVVNNEPLEFKQLKNRYYEPGLLSKVMGHNNGKLRNIEAFTSVNLFPQVKVIPPANSLNTINISLTNRGGGIGKVRVLINGKEISSDARGAKPDPNARAANIQLEIPEALLIANEENSIQVLAWNKEDYLSSRGELVKFALPTTKKAEPPTLHAIVIGTSRYADSKLNLTYSGKDATDIATAISISAKRLFGSDKVKLKLLTDDTTRLDAILPTRDNIVQSFADATKAASSDILVIYMAGHGVMAGNGEDEDYYYLTQEARSSDLSDPAIRKQYGIASAELTEWIKKIPALKQVMILDTCAAGGAAAKLVDKREFSFDQTRSLERLKDRTGFHILMGAAANKQSLEASRFGQGLLTYALLQGVKGAALRNDQSVDVQKIFQYAVDEVPKLAGSVGGIQRPQIASPLGSSFDIGLLTTSDKLLIPLATVKPMILRATFQDKEEGDDTLLLSKQINSLLREQAARLRGSQLVYVDADELPGAWRMTGLYQQSGDNVTVRVLMKEGKTKKNFSVHGKVDDIQGLADIIMAQAQEMLGN